MEMLATGRAGGGQHEMADVVDLLSERDLVPTPDEERPSQLGHRCRYRYPVFQTPLLYRVHVYDDGQDVHHVAFSRLDAAASRDVATDRLRFHLDNHGRLSKRIPTPFTAVTTDLAWALSAMYGRLSGWKTHLLLIDPGRLPAGALFRYNALGRDVPDPHAAAKANEFLVWATVPPEAIVHAWSHARVDGSGLMQALPALRQLRSPNTARELKSLGAFRAAMRLDRPAWGPEPVERIARALVAGLKMETGQVWIRQLFLFLLGLAWGVSVHSALDQLEFALDQDEEARRLVAAFEESMVRLEGELAGQAEDEAGDELTRLMQKLAVVK